MTRTKRIFLPLLLGDPMVVFYSIRKKATVGHHKKISLNEDGRD